MGTLLKYGASPITADNKHITPILYACIRPSGDAEQVKTVRLLLNAGAEFGVYRFEGVDLVDIAVSNGNIQLAQLIREHMDQFHGEE